MRLTLSVWIFALLLFISVSAVAKRPSQTQSVAPLEVYSIKVDYGNSQILVEGAGLDPTSASATLAGVALNLNPASTDSDLLFDYSTGVAEVVNSSGNYIVVITTADGSFTTSAFIPFGLVYNPPSGDPCPCQGEWDYFSNADSPYGYAELTPYCSQDSTDFVTVQFYDTSVGNYWVSWTSWDSASSTGMCAQYIDGPTRNLTSEGQFDACADYLRSIVEVWGSGGSSCLY
ncbi:hypothetical protein [Marinobacterium mangrovicola]|uniref:Uncharacterized protein n=1 Tax=Marinobacterium mangrovicola TaxID=1476959 RepID=A0A4V2PED3_9GAMM|nr:hypothetical protein [Marinobacterium mangrovicola]TCK08676.1 hypothetical protein CLV83_0768 [Marinobacterium mangrovicola]